MILHKPSKQLFPNRLAAKRGLGGEVAYNEAHRNRELLYINSEEDIELLNQILK